MRAGQLTRTGSEAAARRNERLAALVLTPTALRLAEASASAVEAALLTMLDLEEPKAGADRGGLGEGPRQEPLTCEEGDVGLRGYARIGRLRSRRAATRRRRTRSLESEVFEALSHRRDVVCGCC
jgi:hypothetical protein